MVDEKLRHQCDLFRGKNGVSVNSTFIRELLTALEGHASFPTKERNDDNLMEQYQFLWSLKLVHRLVQSLERLNMNLSEIETNQDVKSKFCNSILHILGGVNDTEETKSQTKEEENTLVSSIWNECITECRGIQNLLLNLTSENESDMSSKITEAAENLAFDKSISSVLSFIKFIAASDIIKSMNKDASIEALFDVCCTKIQETITQRIGKLYIFNEFRKY